MRFSHPLGLRLLALAATIEALTITEPSESTVINPQQPFTIKWTATLDDPQTLTFSLTGAGDFSITQYLELVANVPTSAGTVEVPANVVGTFGQYKIEARDASTSTVLTMSPGFYLAQGNDQTISITSNGGASGDASTSAGGTAATTSPISDATDNPQVSTVTGPDGTSIVLSGTVTPTNTPTSTSRSASGNTSGTPTGSATSSATPTQTPNAQVRLGGDSNAMILSMAGVVAGLVALVA